MVSCHVREVRTFEASGADRRAVMLYQMAVWRVRARFRAFGNDIYKGKCVRYEGNGSPA